MLERYLSTDLAAILGIGLCALGIYLATIVSTRIAGKRSFSKMSSFDFAMTVSVGSVIATTVVSKSVTLAHGVVALCCIYLLQMGAAYLRRFSWFSRLTDNRPIMLMKGPNINYENLKKSKVTEADLRSKLREANVIRLSQVKAVVFEATGDISVLHGAEDKEVEDWLMEDMDKCWPK